MHVFEFVPHQGFGPIRLGSARSEAREALAALGFPLKSAHGASDYFGESSIQLECGPDDRVWFIGVFSSRDFTAQIYGRDVFSLPARELFDLIAAADHSGPHQFTPTQYRFPTQIVTLWDAAKQYDEQGGYTRPVWEQVGIGNDAYAAAAARIHGAG